MRLVGLYLLAVVLANLSAATWGPAVTVLNAFLFIGLDLTSRDALHERWLHRGLWMKMFTLIAIGSLLSWALNRNAGQIAIASLIAFATSGLVDLVAYQWLRTRISRFGAVNGSNVLSALADSVVFPTLAFGGFLPLITAGQWAAKVGGGFIWLWLLRKKLNVVAAR